MTNHVSRLRLHTWTPSQFVRHLAADYRKSEAWPTSDLPTISREILADIALQYHEEHGLLSSVVENEIQAIRQGAILIRLAHQPNFLPYMNLIAQMVYLNVARDKSRSKGLDAVGIVLLVDHDVCSNRRFRVAEAWDGMKAGHVRRFVLEASKYSKHPMFVAPSPNEEQVKAHVASLLDYANSLRGQAITLGFLNPRDEMPSNLISLSHKIMGTDIQFKSLADFSIHGAMVLFNDIWATPLIFIPLSRVIPHLSPAYNFIERKLKSVGDNNDLLWSVCERCGVRTVLGSIDPAGGCTDCRDIEELLPIRKPYPSKLPRVLFDDLADYVGIGIAGGTTYLSGRDHLAASHRSANSADIPVRHETCWTLSKVPPSPASDIAYRFYQAIGSIPKSAERIVDMMACGRHSIADVIVTPEYLTATYQWLYEGLSTGDLVSGNTPSSHWTQITNIKCREK